jgi:sialic acid synthase SpsE
MERSRQRGIIFLSSPFEQDSADLLAKLGVAAFKIPSGELTNLALLSHVASKRAPMIVSTGMATLDEVAAAVAAIRAAGNEQLALLHCVSQYPANPADANLRAMATMAQAFGLPVGYSDHTPGFEVALAAAALGACVIEKHLTLDRDLPGPDHQASLEPEEFARMVRGIRSVESALGDGRKEPAAGERETALVARKSLVAAVRIPAGTTLTSEAVTAKRPGTGLSPSMLSSVVGRTAAIEISADTILSWEMLR